MVIYYAEIHKGNRCQCPRVECCCYKKLKVMPESCGIDSGSAKWQEEPKGGCEWKPQGPKEITSRITKVLEDTVSESLKENEEYSYWKPEERLALLHGGGRSGSTVCGKVANEPNSPAKEGHFKVEKYPLKASASLCIVQLPWSTTGTASSNQPVQRDHKERRKDYMSSVSPVVSPFSCFSILILQVQPPSATPWKTI